MTLPYTSVTAVTPSDTAVLPPTAALYVGTAGNVAVMGLSDGVNGKAATVFNAVPAGTLLPVSVVQVKATGTTATNIIALR